MNRHLNTLLRTDVFGNLVPSRILSPGTTVNPGLGQSGKPSGVLRPIAFQVGPEQHWNLALAQLPQPDCRVSSIHSTDINMARLDTIDDDTLNLITMYLVSRTATTLFFHCGKFQPSALAP